MLCYFIIITCLSQLKAKIQRKSTNANLFLVITLKIDVSYARGTGFNTARYSAHLWSKQKFTRAYEVYEFLDGFKYRSCIMNGMCLCVFLTLHLTIITKILFTSYATYSEYVLNLATVPCKFKCKIKSKSPNTIERWKERRLERRRLRKIHRIHVITFQSS